MLGFSPFSAGPLSEASQTDAANAFLTTILSTTGFSAVTFDAKANQTLASSSGNFATPSVDFVAKANITTGNVAAQALVGGDFHSYGQANVTPTAVTSTSIAGTLDFDAKAFLTLVSATANYEFNGVDFDAKANITPVSVTAAFADLDTVDIELFATAEVVLDSVQGNFIQNLGLPDAVKFDYEQFADKYSRYRTLVLLEEKQPELHFTIYIPQGETRTVFIEDANREGLNNTVFIPKENFTVFIDARQDRSSTVLITN